MDHGGMDHGDMGHGGGGAMPEMCNMNMLFTWDTNNLCIVFKQWHVRGNISLMFSLLAVVLFCVGYEWLRGFIRKYETEAAQKAEAVPSEFFPPPTYYIHRHIVQEACFCIS
jgi:copper transporter 1